jgi:predicted metal-binding protein
MEFEGSVDLKVAYDCEPFGHSQGPAQDSRQVMVYVCVTCGKEDGAGETAGQRMLAAISAAAAKAGLSDQLVPTAIECLSVCKRPCTIAIAAPGKWTYVYGDIDPANDATSVVEGIGRYADSADGLVPWRERPERFRKGVIARTPPLPGGF